MKYKKLFSISLLHSYFGASFVPEIAQYVTVEPSPQCVRQMKQYRLLWREMPGRQSLITPHLDSGDTFLPKQVLTFRFFLQITDPNFFHFTNFSTPFLKKAFSGLEIPRYKNNNTNLPLSLDLYKHITIDTFSIREERSSNDGFFLQSQPIPGLVSSDFTLSGLGGSAPSLTYDDDLQAISFDTTPNQYSDGQNFQLKYRAVPDWTSKVFGLVDITIDGANINFEQKYSLSFEKKDAIWHYLIIGNNNLGASNLEIENGSSGLSFNNAVEETSGATYERLKTAFPTAKFFRISSNAAIPYERELKTGIKLKKDGDVIINNLPNPSPAKQGIEIINIHS